MSVQQITILAIPLLGGLVIGLIMGMNVKKKIASRRAEKWNKAYLKGLNYIISDEPDKAIKEFTKVVKIDSDTIEAYLGLGKLFRDKGDVDRATRIHQSIIVRPSLDEKIKIQALMALGVDYKHAGFLGRAAATFKEVLQLEPNNKRALVQLQEVYEDEKDWESAYVIRQRLSKINKLKKNNVLAHLQVELGKILYQKGEMNEAIKRFKNAMSLDKGCVDAYLHLGDLYFDEGKMEKAVSVWEDIMEMKPEFAFLAYKRLEKGYFQLNKYDKLGLVLERNKRKNPQNIQTYLTLGEYYYKKGNFEKAIDEFKNALKNNPWSLDAHRFIGRIYFEQDMKDDALKEYKNLLEIFVPPEESFYCTKCGYGAKRIYWKCPQCRAWDTFKCHE